MAYLTKNGVISLWKHIVAKLNGKVDKVDGKGLSTNDYTTEDKDKLNGIEAGANKTVVDEVITSDSTNPVQNRAIYAALENKQPVGDYALKSDVPSIEGLATESYVNEQIEAIPAPDVSGQIDAHNTAIDSHSDIRTLISDLAARLNTLADSDDTTLDQLSEIVTYIKSNKTLIENVTTNKVNVADIADNLTTEDATKPLSAAQGVALKALISSLESDKLDAAVLPTPTAADAGKFLRVSAEGKYELVSIPNAEEATF